MFILALFSILSLILSLTFAQDTKLEEVKEAFDNADIAKNATITFEPSVLLEVAFPQHNGLPKFLKAGIQLPKNATISPPFFSIIGGVSDPRPKSQFPLISTESKFVITTIDLDAPTPQNTSISQVRHFLAGNLTTTFGVLLRNTTAAITEFKPPSPPKESDVHRYVFLIYAQPEGFDEQEEVTPKTPRQNFNISKFADRVGLGDPLGGTFMLVGPD